MSTITERSIPPTLPACGLLRLPQIIGQREVTEAEAEANRQADQENRARLGLKYRSNNSPKRPRKAIAGLIPMSQSAWWKGIKTGRYPKPMKIGDRAVAWRVEDIRALIENGIKTEA